jgi:hypothetical protein
LNCRAARSGADAGMTVPALTLAIQADEFRAIRARDLAAAHPTFPKRRVTSCRTAARTDRDLTGWALFNQDKLDKQWTT